MHSILILFQVTVLNVAINSNNKALLTVMMSNNVSTSFTPSCGRYSVAGTLYSAWQNDMYERYEHSI